MPRKTSGKTRNKQGSGLVLREDEVCLGRVMAPFGLRGEVKLYLYNPSSSLLRDSQQEAVLVLKSGQRRSVRLSIRPGAGKRILARVEGVQTPEAAAPLIDSWLVFPKASLPEPDEDDVFYHHQLLGLAVQTESGEALGTIHEIHETGPFDMWVLRGEGRELWVPFRSGSVLEVRLGEYAVVVESTVLELGS